MTQSRLWKRAAAVAAAVGCLTAASAASHGQELEALRMFYPQANSQYWDFDVAIDKGFFRDEKFEVVNVAGMSTPQAIQMLITQDIMMSSPQPDALLVAISRGGKDLALMAQPQLRPDWLLVGGKDVKQVSDLKGKVIGSSALGGTEQLLAEEVLMRNGLKKGDWSVIVVGLTPAKLAALQKGSVAAAILYQPSAQEALKQGLHSLAKIADLGDNVSGYYVVNRAWAAQKDRGPRVSRAIQRAHAWLHDPANRKEAIAILQKYTKRSPDVLEKVYDQYFVTDKIYPLKPVIRRASLAKVIAGVEARGEIKKGAIKPDDVLLPAALGGLHD